MNRPQRIGATVSLVLAVVAAAYLLLAQCAYRGVSVSTSIPGGRATETQECLSLIEVSGLGVARWILLPVVIVALAVFLMRARMRVGVWVLTILLLAFCVLTGFSIGLLFFPAALALLVSAILQQAGAKQPIVPVTMSDPKPGTQNDEGV